MSNKDLVVAASKIRVVTRCRNTMGERGVLGIRVQPNHPGDDLAGILLSAVDGLLFGCGDAVIGVNPATESVDVVAHHPARARPADRRARDPDPGLLPGPHHDAARLPRARRTGGPAVPVDRRHRGGQRAASASTWHCLREGRERVLEHHRGRDVAWVGDQVMYFETGQGSALSAGRPPRRRSAHARGAGLRRGPGVRSVPGQQRRRLHRPGVPVRRAADHPGRARGPLHGQAARPADGRGRLLHQPRGGRPELGRQPADAAGGGRLQLLHGRALLRRRDAQLPVDQLSRRRWRCGGSSACGPRRSSPPGWRRAACDRRPSD